MKPGYLILEDGRVFEGWAPEWQLGAFKGEVVFTTGMCGYMESLTDPSFAGQILAFTYPLIGNYGIAAPAVWESKRAHVAGVVVNESCDSWSHHSGLLSLKEWLRKEGVPLLTEVDTRALTKILRNKGTMLGALADERVCSAFYDPSCEHLVERVSISNKTYYGKGVKRIVAVDCGMKESMLRQLSKYPVEIVRVPHDYDYTQEPFDGVFFSNGPGDPMRCIKTIEVLQKAMQLQKPIFGVCLGSQMLGLAAGAKTYKLPLATAVKTSPARSGDQALLHHITKPRLRC